MKQTSILVLAIILRLQAVGQVESGTLVVVNATRDEVVVAADSRTHTSTQYADDRCKVSALGNKMIFAAAGKTAHGPFDRPTKWTWDSHAIARSTFASLLHKRSKNSLSLDVANAWASEVRKKLFQDLRREPDETLSGVKDDTLVTAMFASYTESGDISIVTVRITYRATQGKSPTTAFIIDRVMREPQLFSFGETAVFSEIINKTERGVAWKRELDSRFPKNGDYTAFLAIGVVELTAEHLPPKHFNGFSLVVVGGDIDALRLKRTGGTEWIQRKTNVQTNCQE
jgi:hypothetical protein